jgi:peptide deformylase
MRAFVLTLLFTTACATTQMNTPPPLATPIVQTGHAVLRERAQEVPVEKIKTPEIQDLITKMIATMRAAPGVGLAAPQIGVGLRIFVLEDREEYISKAAKIETTEKERVAFAPRVFINPVLTPIGEDRVTFFEGCLSVSGFAGLVERALEVEVKGLDEHGEAQTWRVRGWPARILQHEFDHIEGRLYIDRMRTRSFSTGEQVKQRFGGKSISEILATPELQ